MGKIYDALKRAEKEAQKIRIKDQAPNASVSETKDESPIAPKPSIKRETQIEQDLSISPKTVNENLKTSDLKLIPGTLPSKPLSTKRTKFSLSNLFIKKQNLAEEVNNRYLPTIEDPHSIAAEQYKTLRSRITSFCQQKNIRTLLITSSLPGEGKSTVASNLSVSIANSINEQALLIDCDLRKPIIHKTFSLTNRPGLSDYLSNNISLDETFQKTSLEKLTVLPAGKNVNNPAELLSSKKMIDLINEISNQYDDRYIILDSTPLQQTPEPAFLSKYIDGIIYVVRAGLASRDIVKRSIDSLEKNKIIGIVFSMAQNHINTNYYSYYYSHNSQ